MPEQIHRFNLNEQNAVEKDLLVEFGNRDFGSGNTIESFNIVIDIGEKPIVKNLRSLYELKGIPIPEDIAIFKSYDIWIVTYSINIPRQGDFRKLKEIQLDIEYTSLIEEQRPPVTIIDVLPQTKFTKVIDGRFNFNGTLDINGQVTVPPAVVSVLKHTEFIAADGKVEVSADTNIVCNISFSLLSTEIVSFGIGNYSGGWILKRTDEKPLIGDQLLMQTILVPQDSAKLSLKARVAAVASGPFGLLPIRLQSEWESLDCVL